MAKIRKRAAGGVRHPAAGAGWHQALLVSLILLDVNDDQEPNAIQTELMRLLRNFRLPAFDAIADWIDSTGGSTWRLELKRRRPGKPKYSKNYASSLRLFYEQRRKKLAKEGHPTPAKTALGELAAEFEIPDNQLRAIIERVQGKRRRPKS